MVRIGCRSSWESYRPIHASLWRCGRVRPNPRSTSEIPRASQIRVSDAGQRRLGCGYMRETLQPAQFPAHFSGMATPDPALSRPQRRADPGT